MATRRHMPVRAKRPTFWEGTNFNMSITTGASVVSTLITEATLEQSPVPTLVRIRGSCLLNIISSAAVPSSTLVVMGIKLASSAAVAGAAVEVPFTQIGSDWIWWKAIPLVLLTGGSVASPNGDGLNSNTRVEIDSKAMRKVKLNELLVFVVENVVSESTTTVGVDGAVRVLFKR